MLRNITLSAEESTIAAARAKAAAQSTTLNALFRQWLEDYTTQKKKYKEWEREFDALMERLSYAQPGRRFTREEANER